MSPLPSRRDLLRAAGVATVPGLAGCGSDGARTTTGGPTTYGITIDNRMTPEDFEESHLLHDPQPATVEITVRNIDPETNETYFAATTTVAPEAERTYEEAFTTDPGDDTIYAMTARIEPLADDGPRRSEQQEDSLTYTPGGTETPPVNPIPVVVTTANRGEPFMMFATVEIHETGPEE